jgi:hypothetical protein
MTSLWILLVFMLEKINWACPLAAVYFTHNFSEIAIFFSIGRQGGRALRYNLPAGKGRSFFSFLKKRISTAIPHACERYTFFYKPLLFEMIRIRILTNKKLHNI